MKPIKTIHKIQIIHVPKVLLLLLLGLIVLIPIVIVVGYSVTPKTKRHNLHRFPIMDQQQLHLSKNNMDIDSAINTTTTRATIFNSTTVSTCESTLSTLSLLPISNTIVESDTTEIGTGTATTTTTTINQVLQEKESDDTTTTNNTSVIMIGIRHGRSVSNEWMSMSGNEWGSSTYNDTNNIRDAPLSTTGIQQAQTLYQQLLQEINVALSSSSSDTYQYQHWIQNVSMIVVSPLTRCLQTYQYVIEPLLPYCLSLTSRYQKPYVHPLLCERLYTISEMGRCNWRELQTEFPNMDWSYFDNHDDNYIWWYDSTIPTPYNTIPLQQEQQTEQSERVNDNNRTIMEYQEWRPHGTGQIYCTPGEPEIVFQRRMEALRHWLVLSSSQQQQQQQQQQGSTTLQGDIDNFKSSRSTTTTILTIGHWGIYKYFTNGVEMENCEICHIKI